MQSQMEREIELIRVQAAKDREEFKKQIQELVEENQRLRSRPQGVEKGGKEDAPRFSIPEEQNVRPKPGADEREDSDWLRKREMEEGGKKEGGETPIPPRGCRVQNP